MGIMVMPTVTYVSMINVEGAMVGAFSTEDAHLGSLLKPEIVFDVGFTWRIDNLVAILAVRRAIAPILLALTVRMLNAGAIWVGTFHFVFLHFLEKGTRC
jgi:hypothetical protein